MILKHLLNGRQFSSFIIVQENEAHSGYHMVRKFVTENLTRGNSVHLFSYAYPDASTSQFDEFLKERLFHFYNCFDDPWCLNNTDGSNFANAGQTLVSQSEGNGITVVIIDSVSYALQTKDLRTICQHILNLKAKNSDTFRVQILGVLNTDLTKTNTKQYHEIDRLAESVIVLGKDEASNTKLVQVTHRKQLGKLIEGVYTINLSNDRVLEYFEKTKESKPKESKSAQEPTAHIESTFRLALDDKEKSSRAQVVLPYLKKPSGPGTGKILYEPDANDDWDDEDPDDDLEI
ncbi:Hypothetical protein NTJ_04905 [Nesidiocoris tenuis]|uniref:Elongator complex protein 5 n=1 Tax=Nesidiocoris tenuis TaxID=355587 RepID=A0ABN7AIK9_9HEMI|nr:Hypothetical protein NTJ_04905 [Nesidiocoris tenuis]